MDPEGRRYAEVAEHNLHLVAHSVPFRGRISLDRCARICARCPNSRTIPYIAGLYKAWGFCLPTWSSSRCLTVSRGRCPCELRDGRIEIGEAVLPGETDD